MAATAMGAVLVLTSCTCTIKEEQQAMINQLRTAEKQLTADIAKAETDRSKISGELSSREAELRKCNEKKAFVQEKLARFPQAWPDWNPAEPVAPPVEPTQPTKKKR